MTRALPWLGTALLLGLFALGASWLTRQGSRSGEPRSPAVEAAAAGLVVSSAEVAAGRRERVSTWPAPVAPDGGEREARAARYSGEEGPRGARKEREFLAEFLSLGREHPDELRARAPEILDGAGPTAEKVALLRALESCAPEAHRSALEHAARELASVSEDGALSVPEYALRTLARLASEDSEARRILWRVAFETPGRTPALRRAATSAFAQSCADPDLDALRGRLLLESDELLVAGAVAELAKREGPRAASVVAYLRPDPPRVVPGD